jgi:ABC-2 type transport system permease protein
MTDRAAIAALVRKDLATTLRNNGIRVPLVVAPFLILVVLPVLLVTGGHVLAASSELSVVGILGQTGTIADTGRATQEAVTGVSGSGAWAAFILEVFLAPLFLLIPLIVATVIAADSFAGERERGTLEPLLYTPTTDRDLLVAKFLASFIPAIVVALTGFVVYSIVANVIAWPFVGRVFFPDVTWLLLAFWVAPAVAALGLGIMTVVSSRVSSLQAAHQVGSLLVLPVLLLLIAQITGTILIDVRFTLVSGGIVWMVAGLLIRTGARSLRREQLAVRL